MSVNLSPGELDDPTLATTARDLLREAGLPADRLMIEVTETALLHPDGRAAQTLRDLRDLGVAVAVDDFGTGFSSLTHLRTLPLTVLKLDRSLVAGIVTLSRDETLCRSLIDLAHQLDMTVIAEGVEEQGQLQALQRMGCDMLQGFLLNRPQPAVPLSQVDAGRTVPGQAKPLDDVRLPTPTR